LDVPFLLVSGKKLDERGSYVRVLLKDNVVCVSNCDDTPSQHTTKDTDATTAPHHHHHYQHQYHLTLTHKKQIVFHIGHGPSKLPLISVSKSLGEPEFMSTLTEVFDVDTFSQQHSYHGDHLENFFHATPVRNADAYSTLIEEVLLGKKESFVSTSQLLLAWQVCMGQDVARWIAHQASVPAGSVGHGFEYARARKQTHEPQILFGAQFFACYVPPGNSGCVFSVFFLHP
jgi:hexose-6-phosphate dehydrogenase